VAWGRSPGWANHPRLLYHYTSHSRFWELLADGQLAPESRPSARLRAALVWLTDDIDAAGIPEGTVAGRPVEVRLTVVVDDAQRWPVWAARHHVSRRIRRAVDRACGDGERWWVVARPVPISEWVAAQAVDSGEPFWTRPVTAPAHLRS
jgi:hypothetical protein